MTAKWVPMSEYYPWSIAVMLADPQGPLARTPGLEAEELLLRFQTACQQDPGGAIVVTVDDEIQGQVMCSALLTLKEAHLEALTLWLAIRKYFDL